MRQRRRHRPPGVTFSPDEIKRMIATADKLSGDGNYDRAIALYDAVLRADRKNGARRSKAASAPSTTATTANDRELMNLAPQTSTRSPPPNHSARPATWHAAPNPAKSLPTETAYSPGSRCRHPSPHRTSPAPAAPAQRERSSAPLPRVPRAAIQPAAGNFRPKNEFAEACIPTCATSAPLRLPVFSSVNVTVFAPASTTCRSE